MANHIYPAYCHDVLTGDSPWLTGTLKCALLDAGASYNSANTIFGDVSAHQLGASQTLGTKAVSVGAAASAGSATFAGIGAGLTVSAIVLYIDPGLGGAARLIAWWDTVVGLPLTTTGADITVDWNGTTPTGTIITAVGP